MQALDLATVVFTRETQREIQLIQQGDLGAAAARQLGAGEHAALILGAAFGETRADGVQERLADGEITVAAVAGFDQIPGRDAAVGMEDDALGHLLEGGVMLGEFALLRQHLPATLVVAREFLQARLLVRLGHVEPEFDDQRAILDQHAFKVDDAVELAVELGVVAMAAEAVLDRCLVPAAEKDGDLPADRH